MIKAGIVGGGGYTAGELIRILLSHPEVKLTSVLSQSQAGKYLYETHKDLIGDTKLKFSDAITSDLDVVFLCRGHGQSKPFLEEYMPSDDTVIIDLSRDFRLQNDNQGFIYGLPELNRTDIKSSKRIANPGCFATAIQLTLMPLANAGMLKDEIHLNGITGSTGAGQAKLDTTHFSWRNNNLSVYKAFNHQHLSEVNQTVGILQSDYAQSLNFIPMRGDFTRGILINMYTQSDASEDELVQLFEDYYEPHAFTFISRDSISLKQVVNTNKAILHIEKHNGKVFVTSIIDNLLKGASGQAVQNMNLCFGLDEKTGLNLKSTVF